MVSIPREQKRIEYHDGIPVYIGYTDAEFRAAIQSEYNVQLLGVKCNICHFNEAVSIWKHCKNYCDACMEREKQADAEQTRNAKIVDIETKRSEKRPQTVTGKKILYTCVPHGHGITDDGRSIDFPANATLYDLVSMLPEDIDRIALCNPLPLNYGSWLIDQQMYREYRTGKGGHYLSGKKDHEHVGRYEHRVSGRMLEVRTLTSWYGEEETVTPEEARDSMDLLLQYLKATFKVGGKPYARLQIYATPAQTFKQIWKEGNAIRGISYPPLPEDMRKLIHGSNGQGRIEMLTLETLKKIPAIFYYDGIFKYAAHAWGMPTGIKSHDYENAYAGKVPARYRISYTVPLDWQHIGLFQTPKEQVTLVLEDENAWFYPGSESAGKTFETWVDGSELDVCISCYLDASLPKQEATERATKQAFHVWNITIHERIVFEVATDRKPLDDITRKIIEMRKRLEEDERLSSDTRLFKLVRGMARNIELHGIGSFHRSEFNTTFIGRSNEAPEEFEGVPLDLGNGLLAYSVPGKLTRFLEQFEHPEWSQLIWARTRASMTKYALSLPRESLIAIRTDAIATTKRVPEWDVNTKVGTLRPKQQIIKKLDAPHKHEELDELIRKWGK